MGEGGGGVGDNRIFSCFSLRIYLFINFQKRHKVTEVNLCQL